MKIETAKGVEDILYQKGLLSSEELSAVKFEHINTGKPVEQIIGERGYVTSRDLASARGEFLNIPFVELKDRSIPNEILDYVPESTARKYKLIPFEEKAGVLSVAMVDPLDLQVIEFIEKKAGLKVKPFIGEEEDILQAIEEYGKTIAPAVTAALERVAPPTRIEERLEKLERAEEIIREAPVARIVSTILEYAVKSRASDVHIEPGEEKTRVRYRIDGVLQDRLSLPKKIHPAVVSRIKILADLKIDEHRIPQDGRFEVAVADTQVDLRISTLPTLWGEKVAIRLLKEAGEVMTLPELGLSGTSLRRIEEALRRPHGIILVTGPTGSGKTVTLASCLSKLNAVRVNIVSLEDPVEIQIPGVNQVQINPAAGLTFASGLRSIVRQDPDIIMVGEIRDTETAQLAVHAALTGHLVLATLHTNSAAATIARMVDMEVEAFLLIPTVNLIIAQRLVRKICPHCSAEDQPAATVLEDVKKTLGSLWGDKKMVFKKGKGCNECGKSGYMGRTGLFETLVLTDKISRMILGRQTTGDIEEQAVKEGMITLKQDGYLKVLEGITTVEEVLRVAEE